ncbi:MAG: Ppx/GppA family phosphatase [Rhodospirillaceae bacterium]|nr:Ppx/GppA family phosphatase [Rhodospirillaceae bacterium]MBT6205845.1 Ppx/GppA family phosphatase [Rhodospirillaceae bacterium]
MGFYDNGRKRRNGRPAHRRDQHTYAAIDLGTNNCRLLVARPSREGFRVIDAFSRIVRLGEGLHASGNLSDAAIERTIEALHVCAGKMQRRGVDRARCIATEACRRAANGTGFLERVQAETGISFEIIDPDEEVRLAFVGCQPLIESWARRVVVLDIGGGSTELSWLEIASDGSSNLSAWVSLPCGVVSLVERFDAPDVQDVSYEDMVGHVEKMIGTFEAEHGMARHLPSGDVQMIGTSGTVTTLAGIHLDLPHYDRRQVDGMVIAFEDLDAVTGRLRLMSLAERAEVPCVGRDRADLVVAGAAILEAVRRVWPLKRLSVADRGLREGVLLGMMAQDRVGHGTPAANTPGEPHTAADAAQ